MELFAIGTKEHIPSLREGLGQALLSLGNKGIAMQECQRGTFTFFSVHPTASGPAIQEATVTAKEAVAGVIAGLILSHWQGDLTRRLIRRNYQYFTDEERERIFSRTIGDLRVEENWEERIRGQVREYLAEAEEMVIEGFVTFRLQGFVDALEEGIDRAVDDFLLEREYKEFIRLLRYFVEVQEPRAAEVHVLVKEEGFLLLDEQGSPIENQTLEEFVVEMVDTEINYDDLLISALITIAPRHLTIHGKAEALAQENIETVRHVFLERVTFCSGCSLCQENWQENRPLRRQIHGHKG